MYNIRNSAGVVVAVVADRQINTTSTPLALAGFNSSGYGISISENFIRLLENFNSDISPSNPLEGMIWYDRAVSKLKFRQGTQWSAVNGPMTTGSDSTAGGLAAAYHHRVEAVDTSVLVMIAGGKIVSVISPRDITVTNLPANITINSVNYPFASVFPFGIEGGSNTANDATDYIVNGKVMVSETARFSGGGDLNKPAGWAFLDLGSNTIGLMIANGIVVAATSNTPVLNGDLPDSISVLVRKDDRTNETTAVSLRSRFPLGLISGTTMAAGAITTGGLRNVQTKSVPYTVQLADSASILRMESTSALTLTLPNNMPVGFEVMVIQTGTGLVTISASSGATLASRQGFTKSAGQHARITLSVVSNSNGAAAVYNFAGDGAV
jgi:hypothetical protein